MDYTCDVIYLTDLFIRVHEGMLPMTLMYQTAVPLPSGEQCDQIGRNFATVTRP